MKVTRMVTVLTVAMFVSIGTMAADPAISGVMVQQRWPWSRLVDIDYVLTCDPGQLMDIGVEAYDGSSFLTLPPGSLSGDLFGVQRGLRRIVWDPTMTVYTNSGALLEFRVALTSAPTPLYMIVDLTKSVEDAEQIEYVYESELTNGLWGAWVRNPVTNDGAVIQSVVWTGVTTDDIYKTDKLVLRRISKGTFNYSTGSLSTTLTRDFYAGVFHVTQRQWYNVMGVGRTANFTNVVSQAFRPMENISYDDIRGATNSNPVVDWPRTGVSVKPSSFMGLLRAKTGLSGFDLPTEAQWEYACRAETTTYFNDGDADANITLNPNPWLHALGRDKYNGGYLADGVTLPDRNCGPTNGTAIVGSYLPNAWGLYDMHGNVWSFCLDWSADKLTGGEDPKGAEEGEKRALRGGSWIGSAPNCVSTYRGTAAPSRNAYTYGFRVVKALP